jgi:preprotein translocase subunit SecA
MLGGNHEFLADDSLRRRGLDPVETREDYEAAWDDAVASMKEQVAAEADQVRDAGGLYVLGTERHESRRIDNQLRGRSGRQGDPGESRFYLSLGDELMRRFNGQLVESIMNRFNLPDDVPIEAGMVTKAIRSAQTQVEQQNFEIRKNVLKYDEVLNKQRTVIYDERRRVLDGENIQDQISHMLEDVVNAYVEGATADGYAEDWDLDKLWTALGMLYKPGFRWQELADAQDDEDADTSDLSKEALSKAVLEDAARAYAEREHEIDTIIGALGGMRELERQVLLSVMDRKWREHLYEMDYLKEGIGMRALAQRDPLIEYQREGFDMFSAMLEGIKEETIGHLFNVQVQTGPPPEPEAEPVTEVVTEVETTAPQAAIPSAPQQVASEQAAARPVASDSAVSETVATRAVPAAAPVQSVPPETEAERTAPQQPVPATNGDAVTASGRHAAVTPQSDQPNVLPSASRGNRPSDLSYVGPGEDGSATRSRSGDGGQGAPSQPSRNRPCPCGSGRKFKQCHGSPTGARP